MTIYQSHSIADTKRIGEQIFASLSWPSCVYFHGDLGTGKTLLCQSIIGAAGYTGPVTSPTYNLIQEYPVKNGTIYHMDLYRLDDPAELEFLGVEDLWQEDSLFLIEWPEKANNLLPNADLVVEIAKNIGKLEQSREIQVISKI